MSPLRWSTSPFPAALLAELYRGGGHDLRERSVPVLGTGLDLAATLVRTEASARIHPLLNGAPSADPRADRAEGAALHHG